MKLKTRPGYTLIEIMIVGWFLMCALLACGALAVGVHFIMKVW